MKPRQTLEPRLEVSPDLILAGQLLQWGALDLELAVAQELEENPALELEDEGRCTECGALTSGQRCPICAGENRSLAEALRRGLSGARSAGFDPEDDRGDWDPWERVSAGVPLSEHLLRQMESALESSDHHIAGVLVGSLDGHGFLDASVDEVAVWAGASPSRVERVLAVLQEQDPPGVGARDVRECLLIQLRGREGEHVGLARSIVADHWEKLADGRLDRLAEASGAPEAQVMAALRYLHRSLNPYPAHAYSRGSRGMAAEGPAFVRPDLIIQAAPESDGFRVELPDEHRYRFRIQRLYRELLTTEGEDQDADQAHIQGQVARARLFLEAFRRRWGTLRRVSEALVEHQADFLRQGAGHLRPLTRTELADRLGLHESTISRALADKFAQLPDERIVPVSDFFDGSLPAKEAIRELIAGETQPLSDGQISDRLAEAGFALSRRTVAKYREAMGILPAPLRRLAEGDGALSSKQP